MAKGTHIIHRLVLDIEVSGRGMAKNAENTVVSYLEQVLLKRIEELLDNMNIDGYLLINKLDLDLGEVTLKGDLPEGLEEKFIEAFQSVTLGLPETENDEAETNFTRLSESQKAFKVFVYFLATGRLPWYALSVLQHEEAWLEKVYPVLAEDRTAKTGLLKLIANEPLVLGRLFAQFSRGAVKKLTALLLNLSIVDLDRTIDRQVTLYIADNPVTATDAFVFFEKIILLLYLRSADEKILTGNHLQEHLSGISYQPPGSSVADDLQIVDGLLSAQTQITEKDNINYVKEPDDQVITNKIAEQVAGDEPSRDADAEVDGIFVNQAGLVILHPFLEYFFKDFGLIQDDDFVDVHARQLGVHLLHYLATGAVNAFEYDLYFEKFFCGWPADKIIERIVDIPQLMRDEADNLLLAVIKHWKALKNTSPGGLREGFLTRTGKLLESETPVRLIIEKKDMDVLLATLPWGIGVVKLPWMPEPFYVEWQ